MPLFLAACAVLASPLGAAERKVPLKLEEYLRIVVAGNETLQAQLFGTEASRQRALAERGAFEPEWVSSAAREANKRPNSVEQQRSLGGIPILDERNNRFDSAIESNTPTGAKIRLGYTLNNFNNNLTPLSAGTPLTRTDEWQSFAGVTLTQPLLKNGGTAAALAALRIAAINSESAFQEYRRQLMVTLSQAEAAYWSVYFAQEQIRFLDESVAVAESILADSREKVKAGKAAEIEVLEAEAGVALRHTKRNEALQRYNETMGQLFVLAGQSPREQKSSYLITEEPGVVLPDVAYEASWRSAVDLNPDLIIQRRKLDEAYVRLGFARNQRLPELNLKASAGLNGLGSSPGESWDEVTTGDFRSWSLGAEFRLPLGGGVRGRHELAAMDATVRQTQLQLRGIETQLANALFTSLKKLRHTRATIDDYDTMVRFNERLLKSERERLGVGKIEARHVLEVEAGLFEVRQGMADARVQFKRATIELFLAEGSTLKRRGIDFTPNDLRAQTQRLLATKPPRKAPPPAAYVPAKVPPREKPPRR
ncbi:MAG: TolC family protein [Chthoniobacteraceae bacterium]